MATHARTCTRSTKLLLVLLYFGFRRFRRKEQEKKAGPQASLLPPMPGQEKLLKEEASKDRDHRGHGTVHTLAKAGRPLCVAPNDGNTQQPSTTNNKDTD